VKELMSLGQHMLVELLLDMEQPVTVRQVAAKINSGPAGEQVTLPSLKQRLDKLVANEWLTKGPSIHVPGRKGKPPTEYALVAGARRVWMDREAELQVAYREQRRFEEELLA
jgi:hypothetical protein